MAELHRVGGLDVAEDLSTQRREWTFQRAGRIGIGAFLLLAIAGLFGGGPLSVGSARDPSGQLRAEYQRFERNGNPTEFHFRIAPQSITNGQVRLWVSREFLTQTDVEDTLPPPLSVELRPDRYVYEFAAEGAEELEIVFSAETRSVGLVRGEAGIDGGPAVSFTQFVFP
jgi:hypothetical protein